MSLLCSNLDKLIKDHRFWQLNCKLGPYIENEVTFYIDKGTIISIKNDYDNKLIGLERSCFQTVYYSKVIKCNIIYLQNENYFNILKQNKLPFIYNFTLKVDLNYCTPYELNLENSSKNNIKISFIK